jgi:hypothetical protein
MTSKELKRAAWKEQHLKGARALTPKTVRGTIDEFRDPKIGKNFDLLVEDDGLVFPAMNLADTGVERGEVDKTPRRSPRHKQADEDVDKPVVPAAPIYGTTEIMGPDERASPSSPAKVKEPSVQGEPFSSTGKYSGGGQTTQQGPHRDDDDWTEVHADRSKGGRPRMMLDKLNVIKITDEQDEEAHDADDEGTTTTRTNYNAYATIKPIMSIKPSKVEDITWLEQQQEDAEHAFFAPAISKIKKMAGKTKYKAGQHDMRNEQRKDEAIKAQLHHVVDEGYKDGHESTASNAVVTGEEETREENRESGAHDRPMKLMWRHPKKSQRAQEEAEGAQGGVAGQQQQQAEDTQGGSVKEFALFDDSTMMMQAVEHHTHETDEDETRRENRESGMHDRPVKITRWPYKKEEKTQTEAKTNEDVTQAALAAAADRDATQTQNLALYNDAGQLSQPTTVHETKATDAEETRKENQEAGRHDRPTKIMWHHPDKGETLRDSEPDEKDLYNEIRESGIHETPMKLQPRSGTTSESERAQEISTQTQTPAGEDREKPREITAMYPVSKMAMSFERDEDVHSQHHRDLLEAEVRVLNMVSGIYTLVVLLFQPY